MSIKHDIQAYAAEIGVDLVGVTNVQPFSRFIEQLDTRRAHYMDRYAYRMETWQRMARPRAVVPDARSVVVLGYYYFPPDPKPDGVSGKMGRIVTYGHLGILKRARLVRSFLQQRGHKAVMGAHRKEAAVRAGLGSIGKNNLVMNPRYGSWVAYQSIVTDAELEPDEPCRDDMCGNCTKCLDACPTGALYDPRQLDPRRCVTCLLTSRDVPESFWPAMDNYILGCDACQEACPRNRGLEPKPDLESLLPEGMGIYPPLERLLRLDEAGFQEEIIGFIQEKISGGGLAARLLRNPLVRKTATWFTKTFMRGKEVLPETFVHASGNLEVYKRNALVTIGNLKAASLRPDAETYTNDPYLGPYARWAVQQLEVP